MTTLFASYLHPETTQGTKPYDELDFVGFSVPYREELRAVIAKETSHHRAIPLFHAPFKDFSLIHDTNYLDALRQLAHGHEPPVMPMLSMECRDLEYFLDAHSYGLGGMYAAIAAMGRGQLKRAFVHSMGGHHAFQGRGHGYCILNPMAVAVRYAQRKGFKNVLIVDWDTHHGDGTQSIFEHDQSVHHISVHNLIDLYMAFQRVIRLGTDSYARSVGQRNIPLLPEDFDDSIIETMQLEGKVYRAEESMDALRTALGALPFKPDIIFIYAGVDSHIDDCGAGVTNWTTDDFITLTRMVLDTAAEADCPVMSVSGGGYKFDTTIDATLAHIYTLAEEI